MADAWRPPSAGFTLRSMHDKPGCLGRTNGSLVLSYRGTPWFQCLFQGVMTY